MGLLTEACARGDKRDMLEALRDITAATIEICEMIDALPSDENTNGVDELAAIMAEYDEYEDPRVNGYED